MVVIGCRRDRRPAAAFAASAPRMPQSTDTTSLTPSPCRRSNRIGLKAVTVSTRRNEVADVCAEQLERATEDDRGRDAVDVVIAVDGNPLLAGNRGQTAWPGWSRRSSRARSSSGLETREAAPGIGALELPAVKPVIGNKPRSRVSCVACASSNGRSFQRGIDHSSTMPTSPIFRNF